MENEVFAKDYRKPRSPAPSGRNELLELLQTPFMQGILEQNGKRPVMIVPQEKANYEYLLERCNEFAERWGGRIQGTVDYQKYESRIEVILPFFEFSSPEEHLFLKEISEKSNLACFTATEEGVRLYIMVGYFREIPLEGEEDGIFGKEP